MKVSYKTLYNIQEKNIICDTNVWYGFNQGKPTEIENGYTLTPTFLTLAELATSGNIVHDLRLYQSTIQSVYDKGGAIIPLDPIEYVLSQQDSKYPVSENGIKKLLKDFSFVMSLKIDKKIEVKEDVKQEILERCRHDRLPSITFADFGNSKIDDIRKEINLGIGKKQHLLQDTSGLIKNMVISIFNEHVKDRNYSINWENFNWNKIELFLKVSDAFFKKVETTKGMKIKPNDAVDWLNILYVCPDDKYLTLEGAWRNYIEQDEEIKHYLYK